jgi:hypothetical protein
MSELFGVHLVRYSRAVPVAGGIASRNPRSSHQLNILRRRSPKRVVLGKIDRLVFCGLYRLSPTVLDALKILQPETIIPNGQKIDTRGSGMRPIFECQIASYDRPPSGERFENLSPRSMQSRTHDYVRIRSGSLAH